MYKLPDDTLALIVDDKIIIINDGRTIKIPDIRDGITVLSDRRLIINIGGSLGIFK